MHGIALFRAGSACDTQLVAHAKAFFAAGGYTRRRAVVACGEYALIPDNHRAYGSALPRTACPGGYELRHIHKSLVPFVHNFLSRIYILYNAKFI